MEYKRVPFYSLAAKEFNQGFEPLDISQMDFNKRLEMRDKAEQIMGPNAMAHISNSNKFNTALKEATNQLKKIFGGAKLPGMLGILDILGMKKEYDQIVEGTHPSGITMTEEEFKEKFGNQVYADGGYVTYPFVKDIFDN